MVLDIRSLTVAALVTCLVAVATLAVNHRLRFAVKGTVWWSGGMGVMCLGFFFLAARGLIPLWLSVLAGNLAIIYGNAMLWIGIRRFLGRPNLPWVLGLLPLVWLPPLAWFLFAEPFLAARSLVVILGNTTFACLSAWELWREGGLRGRLARVVVALLNLGQPLILVPLSLARLWGPAQERFLDPSPLGLTLALVTVATFPAYAAALVMMVGEYLQEELKRQATFDPLTGLLNRRAFFLAAEREMLRSRRGGTWVALVLADLDHFKAINDRHGHLVGDAVLRQLAQRLGQALRGQDLVCRYGGEEFLLLLPETGPDEGELLCQRLRSLVAGDRWGGPQAQVGLTISLGIAAGRGGAVPLAELISRADQALYQAKRQGRDRVCRSESTAPPPAGGEADPPL